MITKYGIDFPEEIIKATVIRLTNQLWKLIPMRENGEDWQKQLDTVILEIAGLSNIFIIDSQFLQLLAKLEGLQLKENIEFSFYRKTVFECINLIQEVGKNVSAS